MNPDDIFACWATILNGNPAGQTEATVRLGELYEKPEAARFMCAVISNRDLDPRFRKLAMFGLRDIAKKIQSMEEATQIQKILFAELGREDGEIVQIMLVPITRLYIDNDEMWGFLTQYVSTASKGDVRSAMSVLVEIIPRIAPERVVANFEYFKAFIKFGLEHANVMLFLDLLLTVDYKLWLSVTDIENDVHMGETLISMFQEQFSRTLLHFLAGNDTESARSVIAALWNSFDYYYRFSLEISLVPMMELLSNASLCPRYRFVLSDVLSNLLKHDRLVIPEETVLHIIKCILELSHHACKLGIVDEGGTDPVALEMDPLLAACFDRLEVPTLDRILEGLLSDAEKAGPCVWLAVVQTGLDRTERVFEPHLAYIFRFLMGLVSPASPKWQCDLAVWIVCSHKSLFTEYINADGCAALLHIMDVGTRNYSLLELAGSMIRIVSEPDQIFERVLALCTLVISHGDIMLVKCGYFILRSVVMITSEDLMDAHFEKIRDMCIITITNGDVDVKGRALRLLSSACRYCRRKSSSMIWSFAGVLTRCMGDQDFGMRCDGAAGFGEIFAAFPESLAPIAQSVMEVQLSFACVDYGTAYRQAVQSDDISSVDHISENVYPLLGTSLRLLETLILYSPGMIADGSILEKVLEAILYSIRFVFKNIVIAGVCLLRRIMETSTDQRLLETLKPQIHIIWCQLVDMLDEASLDMTTAIGKAMYSILSVFGNSIMEGNDQMVVELCMGAIERRKRPRAGQLDYERDHHESFVSVIREIILGSSDAASLMEPFFHRLMNLYTATDARVSGVAISIFRSICERPHRFPMVATFLERSIAACTQPDIDIETVLDHAGLLRVICEVYPGDVRVYVPELVRIIMERITRTIIGEATPKGRIFIENMFALISVFDSIHDASIMTIPMMTLFLRFLPFQYELPLHNIVYGLLLRRFEFFHQSEISGAMIQCICKIFTVPRDDILNALLPAQQLREFSAIIIRVIGQPGAVEAIFSDADEMRLCAENCSLFTATPSPS